MVNPEKGRKSESDQSDSDQRDKAEPEEGIDEDETWSNRPADAAEAEEGDDEEEVEEEPAPVERKTVNTAKDILTEEVLPRAKRAGPRMRPHLTGSIAIEVSGKGERYLFDWRAEEPQIQTLTAAPQVRGSEGGDAAQVDCLIRISETHLFQVRSGDLNPQIAMLGDKIKVDGKVGLAMYFFNLVGPRVPTH